MHYDIVVTGLVAGKGRYLGKVGALITSMGRVSVGLTDEQRAEFVFLPIGTVIEVECQELTKTGKFRRPRFICLRPDNEDAIYCDSDDTACETVDAYEAKKEAFNGV